MKIIKSSFIICLIVAITAGCSKDALLDLNEDTKNPTNVSGEFLFSNAQKELSDHMASTNVNNNILKLWSQYWTECQYPDESQYDLTKRNIPRQVWTAYYRNTLANLNRAKQLITEQTIIEGLPATEAARVTKERDNKLAIADILMVFTYARLVDTFGNIPYSEALDIDKTTTPKYDDAEEIYKSLFERLEASLATLDPAHASFTPAAEYIYNGDVASWIIFANSLKFRMATTVAEVPSLNPALKAQEAVTAGIISSQAENAYYPYVAGVPNTNPLWVDLVASGRKDFVSANTLVDYMNGLDDPRREFYFDSNRTDSVGGQEVVIYEGGTYGATNVYANNTQVNLQFRDPTYPNTLLSYSEMQFYLAEAAENGLVAGVAETHYNEAIRASIMEDWGGTQADADTYLGQTNVAWGSAPGTWQEKIAMQEWIAFYMRGLEGWTTWRRLDAPVLNTPPIFDTGYVLPVRYRYPIEEQTINGANWAAAATAIGGDEKETHIFWDKH